LSGDALVPGEQFGAGGANTVRGFDERVLSADSGLTVNAEAYTPNFCSGGKHACRMLAFYDTAFGKRNEVLPGEMDSTTISSAGIGLRLSFGSNASVQADWGRVIKEGAVGSSGKSKLHMRLSFAY
jgi:hemolysin activation/secretion protein